MHKLDRPDAPICLNSYRHGRDNWSNVSPNHKNEIWLKLNEMQGSRCAYCECSVSGDSHIEHFRQRGRYPQGTFEWTNLFGSCNRENSCGKHKDKLPPYSHSDLIKMDDEDPEFFLLFLPDGNVVERAGLERVARHRAQETIRVFNLKALRQIRRSHLAGVIQTAEYFTQLATEFEEEDWRPLLEEELDNIKSLPFSTAMKHILQM